MSGDDLTCPCCGYKTISDEHEICELCGWQYNDYQNARPEDSGGPNKVCLKEAQKNFADYGAKTLKFLDVVRSPSATDKKDANWMPM